MSTADKPRPVEGIVRQKMLDKLDRDFLTTISAGLVIPASLYPSPMVTLKASRRRSIENGVYSILDTVA